MQDEYENDDFAFEGLDDFIPEEEKQKEETLPYTEYEDEHGTVVREYYKGDDLHKEDGPAVTKDYADGTSEQYYYQNGLLHRVGGPAFIDREGNEQFWVDGVSLDEPQSSFEAQADDVLEADGLEQDEIKNLPSEIEPEPDSELGQSKELSEVEPDTGVMPGNEVSQQIAEKIQNGNALDANDAQHLQQVQQALSSVASNVVGSPGPVSSMVAATSAPVPSATTQTQVQEMTGGEASLRTGFSALAQGGMALAGGLASVAGVAGNKLGVAASGVANHFMQARPKNTNTQSVNPDGDKPSGVSVLPKMSEYRVSQTEKMQNDYKAALEGFWGCEGLADVKKGIEAKASELGINAADVISEMKPGGQQEELRADFLNAVKGSEKAQEYQKNLNKSLDGWLRQYEKGSEEMQASDDVSEDLRERFEGSRNEMEELVTQSPVFGDDDKSHAQRFKKAMEKIAEKLKEIVERLSNLINKGKTAEKSTEAQYEP